jgi:hypothetical protein
MGAGNRKLYLCPLRSGYAGNSPLQRGLGPDSVEIISMRLRSCQPFFPASWL